jgi:hypothetical protein
MVAPSICLFYFSLYVAVIPSTCFWSLMLVHRFDCPSEGLTSCPAYKGTKMLRSANQRGHTAMNDLNHDGVLMNYRPCYGAFRDRPGQVLDHSVPIASYKHEFVLLTCLGSDPLTGCHLFRTLSQEKMPLLGWCARCISCDGGLTIC